jgi:RpiB/LacA/LacB family sugar-phosphate isomerase
MTIGIAADHGGFELKQKLIDRLQKKGIDFVDFGALAYDATDDYPDFIVPLARGVAAGEVDRGIAVCGSGVGAAIVANKIRGVRASLINETYSAHQGVEHDDLNMICLGGRVTGEALAGEIVDAFLDARYTGEERHRRRLAKIAELEKE